MSSEDILTGQQVWQSTGGQQLGSIWGHGAYQAPDWTADWLHRESEALLAMWSAREYGDVVDGARRGAPRVAPGAAHARAAHEHLRPGDRSRHRLAGSRGGDAPGCGPLRRPLRRGTGPVAPASGLRHAGRRGARRRPPRGADRLLLLDQLGRRHEPAGPGRHLHEQLAARAADRQPADQRQRHSGRWSAWSCCWPASAPWCGGRRSARSTNREWRRPRPTPSPP